MEDVGVDLSPQHGLFVRPFSIKGINWYGSESRTGPPGGLARHPVRWYMDFLKRNNFNAIRFLFNQ